MKKVLVTAVAMALFSGNALAEKACPFCMSEAELVMEQARAAGEIAVDTSDRSPVPEYYPIKYGSYHKAGVVDPGYDVLYAGKAHLDHKTTHEIEKDGVKETVEAEGRHLFFAIKNVDWGHWGAVNRGYSALAIENPMDVAVKEVFEAAKGGLNDKTGLTELRKYSAPAKTVWHDRVEGVLVRGVMKEVTFSKGAVSDTQAFTGGNSRRGPDEAFDPILEKTLVSVAQKGEHNTDVMMSSRYDKFGAARVCRDMGPDWFLPSFVELSYLADALVVAKNEGSISAEDFDRWHPGNTFEAIWTSNQIDDQYAYTALINESGSLSLRAADKALYTVSAHREYVNSNGLSTASAESAVTATPHAIVCARH